MAKIKFEYVWLDGYKPEPSLRSKTKVLDLESYDGALHKVPMWSFDGSSTEQAEGHSSDCLLKPVAVYPDAERENAYLVMSEVLLPNKRPHPSNTRAKYKDNGEFWFGFEQEYIFSANGRPLGFPENGFPGPQGPYYCAVGHGKVDGREIVEHHLDVCLHAGIDITGINAEVMLGQWEFQCFAKGAKKAADDLWMARYLLHRTAEEHGVVVDLQPKPLKGNWNGSGMHTNFSNKAMREKGGKKMFTSICDAFGKVHKEHIAVYGSRNDERLTGFHETQSIDKFSYGVSHRGASIRIPISTVEAKWKGYLEDRRPASNADSYLIAARILQTVDTVK